MDCIIILFNYFFNDSQDSQEINNSGPLAKGVPSSLPESGVPIEMVSAPNTSQDDSLSRCKFDLQVHYITSSSGSDSNCTCSCPESTQQSAKPDKEKDCSSNENEVVKYWQGFNMQRTFFL